MIDCEKIKGYLDEKHKHVGPISAFANNPKITSNLIVYNFDKIKSDIYRDSCASVDVLLVKKNLNLIEFKTGFCAPDDSVNEKTKKENLQLRIRLKAYESLHLLQTAILEEIEEYGKLEPHIKTIFCAVIDTERPEIGDEVYTDILADAGGIREYQSLKVKIAEDVLRLYRKETTAHKKLFYDETFVLYDYEFDSNIGMFK